MYSPKHTPPFSPRLNFTEARNDSSQKIPTSSELSDRIGGNLTRHSGRGWGVQTPGSPFQPVVTARSELRDVLFLALSVTFLFAYEISRESLNGFAPNSQERRV